MHGSANCLHLEFMETEAKKYRDEGIAKNCIPTTTYRPDFNHSHF